MDSATLWAVGGESGSLLVDIPLASHGTLYSLEHLLSICFMLGASMYNVSYDLPNTPAIGDIFIILQVKKMKLSLSD